MDQGLITSKVPRALDIKTKLFGYELPDLLLIFMNLSLTSLVFGGTAYRYPLVWGSTMCLALCLHFVKRGRPEGYLQQLGEFIGQPAYRAAGGRDSKYRPLQIDDLQKDKS
jgi:hypothetical protein